MYDDHPGCRNDTFLINYCSFQPSPSTIHTIPTFLRKTNVHKLIYIR